MKKTLIAILTFILTAGFLIGCGNKIAKKNLEQKNNSTATTIEDKKSQNTEEGKKAEELKKIGDSEKMDDSQFLSTPLQGEEPIKLDEVDSIIEGLGDLDTLINTNDPIADIPTK